MAVPAPIVPKPDAAAPLLEVRDLRTYFYRRGRWGGVRSHDYVPAVDGVSFELREGETLGIVGESGSGKTTLGRTILGLTPASGGSVRYRGKELVGLPVRELREVRKEVQMIFQDLDAALNPKMTVGQLLSEALTLHKKRDKTAVRERSEELLDLVKLKPAKLAAYPPELSGGEKRRVSIARVLAVEPKLIIADEPLSALDVSIAAQVANLLRDLQERLGLTYLFISHDLRMVELVAHRVIVMYFGQVVENAAASRLARGGRASVLAAVVVRRRSPRWPAHGCRRALGRRTRRSRRPPADWLPFPPALRRLPREGRAGLVPRRRDGAGAHRAGPGPPRSLPLPRVVARHLK